MSSSSDRPVQLSDKLKEIGSWVRETIIITVNEIADAVMDDIPDDLVEPMLLEETPESTSEKPPCSAKEHEYVGGRAYSSSDTGSTQSCEFDEPDYDYLNCRDDDFPTTLNRASLISRISTLYTSGFGIGNAAFLNENRKLVHKSSHENDDLVVVVDTKPTHDMDDESDWIKL